MAKTSKSEKEVAIKFFTRIWKSKEEFIETMKTSNTPEEAYEKLKILEEKRKKK